MSIRKKPGLGKGLSALLNNSETDITTSVDSNNSGIQMIEIKDLEANPFQPRTEFENQALEELSESIRIHGIIQPITVRKMGYDKYQLISGERRTRAAILAGLTQLPAYIRLANDQDMLEMAIIENIQRENLNAMEISLSYKRLLEECNLNQEDLGERVGKDRSTVSNFLRLLKLPEEIQIGIRESKISMGHAKAILSIDDSIDQIALFQRILSNGLSVRATEDVVKSAKQETKESKNSNKNVPSIFEMDDALKLKIEKLSNNLGTSLKLKPKGNKGEIVIPFHNYENLEQILSRLTVYEEM